MKHIISSVMVLLMVGITIISCNQASNKNSGQPVNDTLPASGAHESHSGKDISTIPVDTSVVSGQIANFSIEPIIKDYLDLKNALAADNTKSAASTGKQLLGTLKKMELKTMVASKQKEYMEITDNAKENAEHIGDNEGKIAHQREHLASLSKDIADLIDLFGSTQKLFLDYCPDYNSGQGAVWISETKEIKNPYYGSEMVSCGIVKKEY
ncbi:DUF3347 domain-containing protein [Polluticaenibacter yanchengensis]|uniref:DUF3347 domain-containing protein n=1 Tax=Polluticaenibacter yanchengensis TaxID=3014562 RepID=A0ABT4UP87_9BACT|nr:DUF3347 domain-containing protein [Chitinophagaceae bacterium LY-5]